MSFVAFSAMFKHMYLRHPQPDIGAVLTFPWPPLLPPRTDGVVQLGTKRTPRHDAGAQSIVLYQQSCFSPDAFFFRAGEHGSIDCQIFTFNSPSRLSFSQTYHTSSNFRVLSLPVLHNRLLHISRAAATVGTAVSSPRFLSQKICSMASTNSATTTGAGHDEAEMRRRKVSSYEKANGSVVYTLDAEDTKKLQQKVPSVHFSTDIVY